jgi:polysaccharide export outer membrane protein
MTRYLPALLLVAVVAITVIVARPKAATTVHAVVEQPPARPMVAALGQHSSQTKPRAIAHAIFESAPGERPAIALCQGVAGPCEGACQRPIFGVDCASASGCGEVHWNQWGPIPWQAFAQGEYVGPPRLAHVPEYRLRPDDEIEFIYRLTRTELSHEYQLEVGDILRIESLVDPTLNRDATVQPDGTIDLLLIGQVRVYRRTVGEIRADLNERYKKYYKLTDINVSRVKTQTRLEDLRAAVDSRFFSGGQGKKVRVTPEGTVSLPAIGNVPAQGLTLDEIKLEVDARYAQVVDGLEVTPILAARAPRFVYVLGEVRNPGRFELTAPTTAIQSIALSGGWVNGGNLREIVVFRRADDWRLLATRLDIRGALYGERPAPADEIWLRDSDIVIVPKAPIRRLDDLIELYLTRGAYSAFPVFFNYSLNNFSTVTPIP